MRQLVTRGLSQSAAPAPPFYACICIVRGTDALWRAACVCQGEPSINDASEKIGHQGCRTMNRILGAKSKALQKGGSLRRLNLKVNAEPKMKKPVVKQRLPPPTSENLRVGTNRTSMTFTMAESLRRLNSKL